MGIIRLEWWRISIEEYLVALVIRPILVRMYRRLELDERRTQNAVALRLATEAQEEQIRHARVIVRLDKLLRGIEECDRGPIYMPKRRDSITKILEWYGRNRVAVACAVVVIWCAMMFAWSIMELARW